MKLFSIDTWKVKEKRLSNWHRWFAWYPINIEIGEKECIFWLQYVQRRSLGWNLGYMWEYKL